MTSYVPLILFGVFLNAGAQVLLKQGMKVIGHFDFVLSNLFPISWMILKNPYILGGLFCYGVSVVIWLLALSRVEVSYAYPFLSLGYIFTTLAAYYVFHENITSLRIIGIAVIIVGVYLVAKS